MNGAWTITCKDLQLLVRDKRVLVMLVLLPFAFIWVIGMSTGQFLTGNDDDRQSHVALVDLDQSETSARVLTQLRQHQELAVETFPARGPAEIALRKGEVAALLVLGDQMEERVEELTMRDMFGGDSGGLAGGSEAFDVALEIGPKIAEGDLLRYFLFTETYRAIFPVVARKNALFRPYLPKEEDAAAEEPPVAVVRNAAGPKTSKVFQFLVPGFTVMFVFFLITIMARSFIAERDAGTLRRLQLAPLSPLAVLVGKTLPFYLTSIAQTSLLFLCGRLLFGMPWGPEPVYLLPVILCTSAAATALGLLLATIVRTDQQVSSFGTSLVLILGGVSGCFIPRAWLPPTMKQISLGTPHAWALQAFDAVLTAEQGVDSVLVLDCCAALLGFAATFFVLGWWRFRVAV